MSKPKSITITITILSIVAFFASCAQVEQADGPMTKKLKSKMIGWWKLDEKSGDTADDSSGNGNAAKLNNDPTWRAGDGADGGALEFDGTDDYAQTAETTDKLQLTGDYTMATWIWPDAAQNEWAGIFSKCDTYGYTNHWTLQFDPDSQVIVHHPYYYWDTGISLSDIAGSWHHIAVVRKENEMTSYLDGKKVNSNTWDTEPGTGEGHLNIGVDRSGSSVYVYKGLIDDIRLYNCALSEKDVTVIYKGNQK